MIVVSGLGAGRAGCFCSVAIAQQIMSSSGPSFIDGWAYDANILDMVCYHCWTRAYYDT